jgi:hypothetical protein
MRTPTKSSALAAALIAFATSAAAQSTEPIAANRPGFNEVTSVLRRGQLQVELSGSVDRYSPAASTWAQPFLLRAGVSDRFELRLRGNGVLRISDGPDATTGFSDLTLGAAWHATDGGGVAPAAAVTAYLSVPSGSRETRGLAASPSAFVPLTWTLSGGRGIALMPGVSIVDEGEGFFAVGAFGAAFTQSIGDRVVAFGEVAGESLRSSSRGASVVTAGVGAAVRVGVRHQIDFGVSRRLTDAGPSFRFFTGFSRRIRD